METVASQSDNNVALHREIERLKADLYRLQTDFSGLAKDAVHAAKAGAAEGKERIERTAKAAAEKGRESVEALEDQVVTHPFVSLAAALAVGLIIGVTLSRKG